MLAAAPASASPSSASSVLRAKTPDHHSGPTQGACYLLKPRQVPLQNNQGKRVKCGQKHTAFTFKTAQVPSSVNIKNADQLGRFSVGVCAPAYAATVSRSERVRLQTAYTYAYFLSTKAQEVHGHRKIECDLLLQGGPSHLTPLPGGKKPYAASVSKISYREARCLQGKRLYATSCARGHLAHSTGVFSLPKGHYPSEQTRYRFDESHCSRLARRWVALNPTADQWRAGFRFVQCFRVTQH